MNLNRPIFIPVILGTSRQGRMSEHVAKFILEEVAKQDGVEAELIDIRNLSLSTSDAGENIKDAKFSDTVMRADALIIVAPEYNHGYPGLLKHVLDTNLKEYIHKAVGIWLEYYLKAREENVQAKVLTFVSALIMGEHIGSPLQKITMVIYGKRR